MSTTLLLNQGMKPNCGEGEREKGTEGADQGRGCLNKSELANIAGCMKMCDWEDRRRKMHGLKEQH
jgi:hypothetical protein